MKSLKFIFGYSWVTSEKIIKIFLEEHCCKYFVICFLNYLCNNYHMFSAINVNKI